MWLSLIVALFLVSYLQRYLPWLWASRFPLGPRLTKFLSQVAPSAFAVLMVEDIHQFDLKSSLVILGSLLVGLRFGRLAYVVATGVFLAWLLHV